MSVVEISMWISFICVFFYIGYIVGKSKRIVKEFDEACDEMLKKDSAEIDKAHEELGVNRMVRKREKRLEAISYYYNLSLNSMPDQRIIRSINMIEAQKIGNSVEKDWLRFGGNSVEWEIIEIEREAMNPLCNVIFKFY